MKRTFLFGALPLFGLALASGLLTHRLCAFLAGPETWWARLLPLVAASFAASAWAVVLFRGLHFAARDAKDSNATRDTEILEHIFGNVQVLLACLDADATFIRVNRAYADAGGHSPEYFVGKNHFQLFPNEENERIFRKVVETGEPFHVTEKPFEYPDQPERGVTYWDWSLYPIREAGGRVSMLVFLLVDRTGNVRSRQSLEREHRRFYSLLEQLPAAIHLIGEDYRIRYSNRLFRASHGAPEGRCCHDLLNGRDAPCPDCPTLGVLGTAESHSWEWARDDATVVQMTAYPFVDMDGSRVVLCMAVDITERKRAERAARSASIYARTLIEASLDPLVTIGPDGRIMDVNEAMARAAGVPREELIGSEFRACFTEPQRAEEVYRSAFSQGAVRDFALEFRRRSGTTLSVLCNATVYRDEAGMVRGVFAAVRDVTLQKETEEALRESERKYRLLLDTLNEGVGVLDETGRIVYVNDKLCGMLRYARRELVGARARALLAGSEFEKFDATFERQKLGEALVQEFDLLTRNGRRLSVIVSSSPIFDEAGEFKGTVAAYMDITPRKRAEEGLRAQMGKLEAMNQELREFAFVASHDLQEPLRKIQAFSDRVRLRHAVSLDEQGCDYLSRIQKAAGRMQALIGDLLKYSRVARCLEAVQVVDLNEVVQESLADLRVLLEESGGVVEVGELPRVEADPVQMRQLFENLIGNALKFRGDGLPVITVSSTPEGSGGHRILVEDNGIGFDEKYLDRIFAPFQRLHGRSAYAGTGMGLAICRKVVERHGGSITASSRPGGGATFVVTLPETQRRV